MKELPIYEVRVSPESVAEWVRYFVGRPSCSRVLAALEHDYQKEQESCDSDVDMGVINRKFDIRSTLLLDGGLSDGEYGARTYAGVRIGEITVKQCFQVIDSKGQE